MLFLLLWLLVPWSGLQQQGAACVLTQVIDGEHLVKAETRAQAGFRGLLHMFTRLLHMFTEHLNMLTGLTNMLTKLLHMFTIS